MKGPYFIGDLHLDHTNIIKYCNRPFSDVEEMNRFMIEKWSSVIKDDSLVFYLGDVAYGRGAHSTEWWLKKLPGNITLIKGNHDHKLLSTKYYRQMVITLGGIKFLLVHDPAWAPVDWDGWIIHGHHHNNNLEKYPLVHYENKTINVGVEVINYVPMHYERLLSLIKK